MRDATFARWVVMDGDRAVLRVGDRAVMVSAADLPRIRDWTVTVTQAGRVVLVRQRGGRREYVSLSRLVMDCPAGLEVDHINHQPLDNRRCNLRLCTRAENSRNTRGRPLDRVSQFKGVVHDPSDGHGNAPWRAFVYVRGKKTWLGRFADQMTAAFAYDSAARAMYGEFANLNFPDPGTPSTPVPPDIRGWTEVSSGIAELRVRLARLERRMADFELACLAG